ncbi:MAG: phosphopantetheine-binding protein, partial [Terriglobales bacterium]
MKSILINADSKTIQTRLGSLFRDVMHLQVPSEDTDLFDTGVLDSQRFVELLLFLEQNFHVQIDLEHFEMENF